MSNCFLLKLSNIDLCPLSTHKITAKSFFGNELIQNHSHDINVLERERERERTVSKSKLMRTVSPEAKTKYYLLYAHKGGYAYESSHAAWWAKGLKKRGHEAGKGEPVSAPPMTFLHDGHVAGICMCLGAESLCDFSRSCSSFCSLLFSSVSVSQHRLRNSSSTSVFLSFVLQQQDPSDVKSFEATEGF
ncbi:hypothetical protein MUK42_03151 [Musa troglodytarum]|uniref:Uncharacterized protein n=1 Tax=Musa troglodytarum TaxID=320322 RepID=A0A9E7H9W4_9LILI|nr:hypothetical protein MUK42_03151 [Musa troglodytarum]URE26298.1 hypothetical protein MUK42_03151 [Musa troglodytarum]URE26301.1 hypothetical protein MUK42_03151 [Musa troglodytarum]URE26303.1 hypothetical protein MUK42_03151 [Musa troglodytarum]